MIRVGNEKGKGNFRNLRRLAISTFLLIFLLDFVFCLFFIASNEYLPRMYLDSSGPIVSQDVIEVVKIASSLILIAAFFQIADGVQAVVLGALRGMQDVSVPAFLIFIAYGAIGFPVSYYFGLKTDLATDGIWLGLLTGLTFSALFLVFRFQYLTNKLIIQNQF